MDGSGTDWTDGAAPLLRLDEAVVRDAAGVAGSADGAAGRRAFLVHLGRQPGDVRDVGPAGRVRRQTLVHQTPELRSNRVSQVRHGDNTTRHTADRSGTVVHVT